MWILVQTSPKRSNQNFILDPKQYPQLLIQFSHSYCSSIQSFKSFLIFLFLLSFLSSFSNPRIEYKFKKQSEEQNIYIYKRSEVLLCKTIEKYWLPTECNANSLLTTKIVFISTTKEHFYNERILLSIYFRISEILEYQKFLKNDIFNILLYITPGSKGKKYKPKKSRRK